jgi:capsular exopolysaccharide synthesis family protein
MTEELDFKEQEINLRKYLWILIRRKYIILLVFAVSLPLILLHSFSVQPLYQATAKLLIERDFTPLLLSDSYIGYDPGFLATQTQIIKSKKVGRQVVEKLKLDETYNQYFPQMNSDASVFKKITGWGKSLFRVSMKLAGIGSRKDMAGNQVDLTEAEKKEQWIESLSQMISNGISVGRGEKEEGSVVNISFVSTNPVLSADIVNSVSAAYKEFLLDMRTQSTSETLQWLEKKAADQREKLEASENRLQQYKKDQNIYLVDDQEAMFPQKVANLSNRLTQVQAEMEEMSSLYQEISRMSLAEALNLPEVAESVTVADLRRKVIDQEQEIGTLSKSLGDKHPRMIRAKEDLQALKEKLNQEIRGVILSIKNKYELAQEQAANLQSLLDQTKQTATLMNDKLIQYEILKRDVKVNNILYERMLQRIKEYDATDTSSPINVWVVEQAAVPRMAFNKDLKRTILMGIIAGLMLGVGLAFFLEYLDNTVKTVEDAESRLNLPLMGAVPLLKDDNGKIETIVQDSPLSVVSEHYKAIRTAVLLSSSSGAPKSVLISSMNPKTGKTVTATNLALAFAQSELRVLLVDADMRRPRIHKVFGLDNKTGLSTCLAGQTGIPISKKEEMPFLHFVPAGPVPPNPSELLSSHRLEKIIHGLRESYDCVIIDSPPMLTVTDAILISKLVDQTLLVIRSGVSTYESMLRGEKILSGVNAKGLGYIVNALDQERVRYDYYYRTYGRYYGRYYTDEEKEKT